MHSPVHKDENPLRQRPSAIIQHTGSQSPKEYKTFSDWLLAPVQTSKGGNLPSIREVFKAEFQYLPRCEERPDITSTLAETWTGHSPPAGFVTHACSKNSTARSTQRKSSSLSPTCSPVPFQHYPTAAHVTASEASSDNVELMVNVQANEKNLEPRRPVTHTTSQQQPPLTWSHDSRHHISPVRNHVTRCVLENDDDEQSMSSANSNQTLDHHMKIAEGCSRIAVKGADNKHQRLVRRYFENKELVDIVRFRFHRDEHRPVLFGKGQKPRTTPIVEVGSAEYEELSPKDQATERHKATERQRRLDHSRFWAELDNRIPDELMLLAENNIAELTNDRGSKEKNNHVSSGIKGAPGKDILHNAGILLADHDAFLIKELWQAYCRSQEHIKLLQRQLLNSSESIAAINDRLVQYGAVDRDLQKVVEETLNACGQSESFIMNAHPFADLGIQSMSIESSSSSPTQGVSQQSLLSRHGCRPHPSSNKTLHDCLEHNRTGLHKSLKRSSRSELMGSRKRASPRRFPPSPAPSTVSSWEHIKHCQGASSAGTQTEE